MKKRSTQSTLDPSRETAGKIATDLQQKDFGKITVADQRQEMLKDYMDNLWLAVENGRKQYPGDFFIVVSTKKERLFANTIRNYFFTRWTAPTPSYDNSVYRYSKEDDALEYLWTLPDKEHCQEIRFNPLMLSEPDEAFLRDCVLRFYDGSLDAYAQQLNKEKKDSPSLILEVQ